MADVGSLAAEARAAGRLGIDTEFLPEGRYRPLLCLVQVAVPGRVELLDPLAGFDPSPLAAVLADPAVEVVMHAGRQDVALLRRDWGTEVTNLFDTQVAAGFAGRGAQEGYLSLLQGVLGVQLPKSASFTRWDARPLTPEQLDYARGDVEHLLALTTALQESLMQSGRLQWAREECLRIAAATDERDPDEVWRRLPRVGSLSGRERAVARELAAWRERTAESEGRPVGSVLKDPTLIELVRRQPSARGALAQIRGLHQDVIRRRGRDLLAVIERAQQLPPVPVPDEERSGAIQADGPVVALAEALVRARALEAGLAYELIAARADLGRIVVCARTGGPEPPARVLEGWRRELVGAELLELLAGGRALLVADGRRVEVGSTGP